MHQITIDQETLVKAVQMYFDSKFRTEEAVKVTKIETKQYSDDNMFIVTLYGPAER